MVGCFYFSFINIKETFVSNQITLTQEQFTALQNVVVQLANSFGIAQTPEQASSQETKMKKAWQSASTIAVSFWTLEQYDWKPLRKWCLDRDLDIAKEEVNGLQVNSYPAQAWLEVYGIVLGKFNV